MLFVQILPFLILDTEGTRQTGGHLSVVLNDASNKLIGLQETSCGCKYIKGGYIYLDITKVLYELSSQMPNSCK